MTNEVPHRRKALPVTQSVLWVPGSAPPPSGDPYLVFMHQRALNALHDHLRGSPDQGVLGFLLGHLYEDPTNQQRFAVIELVMRLTVGLYGDKTTVVVSRVWDKMHEELTRAGAQLLGWYHSHPPGGIELTAGDLATHATYFGDPWQAALVLATPAEGTLAGLYLPNREGPQATAVQPFYELLDPRALTADGRKRASVRWGNYQAHRPPAGVSTGRSGPVPAVPVPESPPATLSFTPSPAVRAAPPPLPAQSKPEPPPPPPPRTPPVPPAPPPADPSLMAPPPAPPPPAPSPRKRTPQPTPRFVLDDTATPRSRGGLLWGAVALLVLGGAAAWYFKGGPGSRPGNAAVAPVAGADRLPADNRDSNPSAGDSGATSEGAVLPAHDTSTAPPPAVVATPEALPPLETPAPAARTPAVPQYVSVARLDRLSGSLVVAIQSYQERARGGDCTILGRGLVAVEGEWTAYNAEKSKLTVQLDGTRTQRDLELYSSVDTVEAHYDRSGCRRP